VEGTPDEPVEVVPYNNGWRIGSAAMLRSEPTEKPMLERIGDDIR